MAAAAAKGQVADMFKIPTPAFVHYKGSHLTFIQNDLIRLDFMKKASEATDPVERMKWIVVFFVSGNFISSTLANCKVPLNPILGETLQRDMPTGERIFCEQISHHPPISAYEVYGPNDSYKIFGHHQYKGWISGGSSFGGSKEGKFTILFKDGAKVRFKSMPNMMIENFFYKTKKCVFYDDVVISDKKNRIEAVVKYNPNFNRGYSGIAYRNTLGWIPGMNGLGQNKDQGRPARADDISIEISHKPGKKQGGKPEVRAKGYGSWLSHVIIDGEELWRIEEKLPEWCMADANGRMSDGTKLLESDSMNRADL